MGVEHRAEGGHVRLVGIELHHELVAFAEDEGRRGVDRGEGVDAASAASPGTSLNINETGVVLTIQTQQPAEGRIPV